MNHTAVCTIQDEYAAQFEALISNTDRYWTLHQSWSDSTAYRTDFMAERLRVSTLLLKAEELRANIDREFPAIHVYENSYVELGSSTPAGSEMVAILRRHVSENIRERRTDSDRKLAELIDSTRKRLNALDGFLRDAATVDSANQNLRLATTIKRLTWVVLAVAIVSMTAGILPDTAKERVIRTLAPDRAAAWLLSKTP
jgi:hypothetical protein